MTKKVVKRLIAPELMNKMLIPATGVNLRSEFKITNNFKVNSTKDFKLMKNLIGMELLLGQRPKILASILGKKSLVCTLVITPKNLELLEWLKFLQKEPVVWNSFLTNFNLFEKGFSLPSVVVKNLRFNVTLATKKINVLDNFIKSAYLD